MKRKSPNDPNVFADTRVGTIKAALLRRLETAGYFSVEGAPIRDVEAEEYRSMTVEQCREHAVKVERLAIKYRRTAPRTMESASQAGYEIDGMISRRVIYGMAMTKGLALLQEAKVLKREFVIPFTARYAWGKPRLLKQGERSQF